MKQYNQYDFELLAELFNKFNSISTAGCSNEIVDMFKKIDKIRTCHHKKIANSNSNFEFYVKWKNRKLEVRAK